VAICDDMKLETEEIFPYLEGRVTRIYNPFNFERIKRLASYDSHLSKKEKELLKDNYIVSVSRLDNVQKDYPTLLKAFKKLKKEGLKEKLYIVGDGPSRKEIEDQIIELNLEKSVKLLGQQKNPYIWMKKASLFVHSSKYEGLPTVLIEAMILGVVIVSSDCPTGPREILDDGKSGILVEVGDVEGFVKGITEGLNQKEKYNKNSKIRVEEFNKERVIKEYEEIIEELIGG
jgi:glycosyltransferase involved in cell wall biosynthesis